MNNGATNHITNELANLSISSEYQGTELVMVGNGNLLPISSIGFSSIPCSSPSRPSLLLNNILFVPTIAKNLLSISQFTLDNNVLIEFHHDYCFVKDKTTHRILLKGNLVNGLYQLDLSKLSLKAAALCSTLKPSSIVFYSSVKVHPSSDVSVLNVQHSLNSVVSHFDHHAYATSVSVDMNTLHRILGHPNHTTLSKVCEILHVPFFCLQIEFL